MDAERFDWIVRTIARQANRRQVLGVLLGGALSGALGQRSTRAAPPSCVVGGGCTKTADCCPTETCKAGTCTPTRGSEQVGCLATGCPPSTDQCQAIVCDQQSGACVPQDVPAGEQCTSLDPPFNRKICCGGTCCDSPSLGTPRGEQCCPTKLQPSPTDYQCQSAATPCPVPTS